MKKMFMELLKKSINRYILLDPESSQRIHALEGNRVTIELKGPGIIFQLYFFQGEIILDHDNLHPADTTIKGTPLSLFRMALTKEDRKTFFADDVSIEGNLDVAQKVMDLFDQLEIDWDEQMSRWIGDVAAHQLGRFVRGIKTFSERTTGTLCQNTNEYLHEEVGIFPTKEEAEDFFMDVDTVRMDVDRLAARIEQLKQTLIMRQSAGG